MGLIGGLFVVIKNRKNKPKAENEFSLFEE